MALLVYRKRPKLWVAMSRARFSPKSSAGRVRDPSDFPTQFLETLSSASADGVYAVDFDQRIVFWGRAAEELTGRKRAEVIGKRCYEVMLGVDSDGHPFCHRECPTIIAARRGRPVHSYDLEVPTADGHSNWYNISIIPLHQRSTRTEMVVHMFRDVTNRRVTELLAQETVAAVNRFSEARRSGHIGSPRQPKPDLTPREMDVLRLVAKGLTTPLIAQKLGIARATARNHANRMLSKLDAHNRVEAIVRASHLGLL
jgi:PAS domain S-box-containing protein